MLPKKPKRNLKPRKDQPIVDNVLRCTCCGYPIAAGQAQTTDSRGRRLKQPICQSCLERGVNRPTESQDLNVYVQDPILGFRRRQP